MTVNRVLITGSNGFVGRALCQRMLLEGWKVRGTIRSDKNIDSLPAGVEAVQTESISSDTDWSKL